MMEQSQLIAPSPKLSSAHPFQLGTASGIGLDRRKGSRGPLGNLLVAQDTLVVHGASALGVVTQREIVVTSNLAFPDITTIIRDLDCFLHWDHYGVMNRFSEYKPPVGAYPPAKESLH
jgi:hypothetical protein